MILISHRGNIDGPNPNFENSPEYLLDAIHAGYDVELDMWIVDNHLYLGHDSPQYLCDDFEDMFFTFQHNLWIHCKNFEALTHFSCHPFISSKTTLVLHNAFWHQEDDFTLTSHRYIWTYPNNSLPLTNVSIAVMPERTSNNWDLSKAAGICSDYIKEYEKDINFKI